MSAAAARELERRIEREREALGETLADLGALARERADLGRRIRERPLAWLGGALLIGFILGASR